MSGRRSDSIGMSWLPRGFKSDPEFSGGDKYDTILQDANYKTKKEIDPLVEHKKQQNEKDNEILKNIINMNFIVIWQEKAQDKTCKCGNNMLCFYRQIPIKYRKDGKAKELMVQGKLCKDCGEKYIVRKMLLERYHEIEG